MKSLIIVGASGFGMEVAFLAKRLGRDILGFLDDTSEKQGEKIEGLPVLGKLDDWCRYEDVEFSIAIGSPRARKSVVEKMLSNNQKPSFATLIDPAAILGSSVTVGEGSIICAGVIATVDINLGKHVIINLNSTIGHECNIGDFVTIAPIAAVSGNISLDDLVEVGTGAALRQKLDVGQGAIIGMGSVLTKSVAPLSVVVGNPARVIKKLES